jgi:hypothetical protein
MKVFGAQVPGLGAVLLGGPLRILPR